MPASKIKIAGSILDLIGNIPLVRLNRIGQETGAEILVKPEFLNPSGSIKDRVAAYMLAAAERDGVLQPGTTIVEASTGNTGTALAMVAAVKGYGMLIVAPARVANPSRLAIPLSFGAHVQTVDTPVDPDSGEVRLHGGRVEILPRQVCRQIEHDRSDVWWPRQFSNQANVAAHRDWTAREILDQTDGQLDAFVASVGTGGTLLGCAQALKGRTPRVLVISCEPAGKTLLAAGETAYPIVPGITDGIIPETFSST